MMFWRPSAKLFALSVAAFVSCDQPTDVDSASVAIVSGSVFDAAGEPLPNASIQTIGNRYACGSPGNLNWIVSGATVSGAAGHFRIEISSFLGSPGTFCFDLVIESSGGSDTIRGIQAQFYQLGRDAVETTGIDLETSL